MILTPNADLRTWPFLQRHRASNDGHSPVQQPRTPHASDRSPSDQHGRGVGQSADEGAQLEHPEEEQIRPLEDRQLLPHDSS